MRIEFEKGSERDIPVNKFKVDKMKYSLYLKLCKFAKDSKVQSFKELYGYDVVYDYSLN